VAKIPSDTARKGQQKGQEINPALVSVQAAKHGVSEDLVWRICQGELTDASFVEDIAEAWSRRPDLWDDFVSPAVREYLFQRERTMAQLGGTRGDLLALYVDCHRLLRQPINHDYARRVGVMKAVDEWLDRSLEEQKRKQREEISRQRDQLQATVAARREQARIAGQKGADKRKRKSKSRSKKSAREIESRRPGVTVGRKIIEIAARDGVKPASVKKRRQRARKHQAPPNPPS
jgi:hypothetical protein